MKIWFAILVVVLALSTTNARGGKLTALTYGGGDSCGAWTEGREHDSQRSQLMKMWLLGFISGANINPERPEIFRDVDPPAIWVWVDNYCRAHPLELVTEAAVALVEELLSRAGQRLQP
jgi:hypothetical protein